MVLKFAPLTVRFDRWTGFACPTERRLFRPEEAVLEITWKSTTGLTVVGFGVRTDAEGAVHWSRALDEEAPRWVFLKGHGAIGGPEAPAAELPLRGARLRDWIADAIRSELEISLLTRLDWQIRAGRVAEGHGARALGEVAWRLQGHVALGALAEARWLRFGDGEVAGRLAATMLRVDPGAVLGWDDPRGRPVYGAVCGGRLVLLEASGGYSIPLEEFRGAEWAAVRAEIPEEARRALRLD